MPAILVASKMKSGLPKPVHGTALPNPARAATHQNGPLKPMHSSLIPLKCTVYRQQIQGNATTQKKYQTTKETGDPQIYTDWANHYLAKSGHKRLIKDLQQDVADGVLLAEIIQVVANEKIGDINGFPESRSQMIENIDACLGFLAAKGVNIKGLCAEEIRNGNLKAILGLFFSLSRYKQQLQTFRQDSGNAQTLQNNQTHRCASPALPPHTSPGHSPHGSPCPSPIHQQYTTYLCVQKPQADLQSSFPSKGSNQKKATKLSVAQKNNSRLPSPSVKAGGAGGESKPRICNNTSRHSQSFNQCDRLKPATSACPDEREKITPCPIMVEHGPISSSIPPPTSTSSSTTTTTSKPWRSMSLSAKHTATSSMVTDKQSPSTSLEVPLKVIAQKSMLEKLKLFNSKPGSKTSKATCTEELEALERVEDQVKIPIHPEAHPGTQQPVTPSGSGSSSPKLALKGIAQLTIGRALAPKITLAKAEKDKVKDKSKPKGKDKLEKQVTELDHTRGDIKTEGHAVPKSKNYIPKGNKGSNSAKKDNTKSAMSGIPKPSQAGKGSAISKTIVAPTCGAEGERLRNGKVGGLSVHKGQKDNRHSSSTSSLVSSEGKSNQDPAIGAQTQSTASSTVSVQLPQLQQQYNRPNTATVAPFMYRSQTEIDKMGLMAGTDKRRERTGLCSKSIHTSLENLTGEDSDAKRLRTAKNIADLRQNLEETMSSLRGTTHFSHSTLETTFDSTITTEINGRALLALSPRPSSALPWRLGSSSPRLQAGDAPSSGKTFMHHGSGCGWHTNRYQTCTPNLCGLELPDKVEELESVPMEKPGYMSDGDVLGKSMRMDCVTTGYLTDGGLNVYSRRVNRVSEGMSAIRGTVHHLNPKSQDDTESWDDSSSVSSGISDTLDTDDLNTSSSLSSYVNTPSVPHQDVDEQIQTDTEKHCAVKNNPNWYNNDVKHSEGFPDSGIKMDTSSKWIHRSLVLSDESEQSLTGRKTPTISQTGSWRRGTSPRTKATIPTNCSSLKSHGKTDDAKVSEKGRLSPRSNSNPRFPLERQMSVDETKKLSSNSTVRIPTSTFGFKKVPGSMVTITASGAVITSGSATVGKIPKSVGISGRRIVGRNTSVDDGYLPQGARNTLQYRSLPRPSRGNSSTSAARCSNRSNSSILDPNICSKGTATLPNPKSRKLVKSPIGSNQTDREKGVFSDVESKALGQAPKACTAIQRGMPMQCQAGRQEGGKHSEMSSPTLHRLFGGKSGSKQGPVTTMDKMKNSSIISNPHATSIQQSGALGTPSVTSEGTSPLYSDSLTLPSGDNVEQALTSVASRPGSAFSPWVGRDGVGHLSQSSIHTSSDSIDVSLGKEDTHSACVNRANGTRTGFSDSPMSSPSASPKLTHNTLPRKQDRYAHVPQIRGHEETHDWLRSPSAFGLPNLTGSSPFTPASALSSPSGTRLNFATLGSPTSGLQIHLTTLRGTNGQGNHESPYDPYSDPRLRNSSMSLEEKSRTMSSSGSFREGLEEVHGSSLSLVSSTSSVYSTPEEKAHTEIRKLRRELDTSQEKVSALTTQLSANAHLVAAFEQSLGNMTIRLQSLTTTAEQKDTELNELRKTIELLKKQNTVTQATINGAIKMPDPNRKVSLDSINGSPQSQQDLRIHRQPSSDSVSSMTSATSHSSIGSNLELDAKNNKKKKNWVNELRSSFKQAFGKKKSPKSSSSHSDIEEVTDSSLPSSPKLPYNGSTASSPMIHNSHSNSLPQLSSLPAHGRGWGCSSTSMRSASLARTSECTDNEAETLMHLRSELRDKEMKLTDIRLEALSSAHQLDQLRESMNRMQIEIERLKVENDRLKMESQGSSSRAPSQMSISPSSVGLSSQLSLTESTSLDMLLEDSGDGSSWKEGQHVKVVVSLGKDPEWKEESRPCQFLLGCIGVSGKTKWDVLDGVVRRLFKEYIIYVDPVTQLGLNTDSVMGYSTGDVHRTSDADTPELLPCGYLVGESDTISVHLKDMSTDSQDSLAFETLIPKPVLQRYISQLVEHRQIIFSGPSGTGKSFLASRLAEYMVLKEGKQLEHQAIATFNVDNKTTKELKQYLSNLAEQYKSSVQAVNMPVVLILDNLHRVSSLGEIFNGLLNCKHHQCPYIIGTMNQITAPTPNLQLHHNFRWVLFANHTEPVKGFLGRFLRRKLLETEISSRVRNGELVKIIEWIPCVCHHLNRFLETHSSSDVTIGPRLFLSCPMDVEGSRVWFTDLWNYSIIPYMLEAVKEGLQIYGRKAAWEDPAKWVIDSFPWVAGPQQHEWHSLLRLRPEDVGFDGYSLSQEGSPCKQPSQDKSEEDPLINMLMRLKETAHCTGTESYDSNSHQDDMLDSSLESTL
ncbi:neuron navigator 2-like [Myxocyprinus asiaticus]|uniref:neuron navigator 2-like n=1 Tax=Myxocyprinus asiaticus TaxID=70543 RepID=UPI002222D042|nr:neuron navigator 2-like [Myxocyprinus asiaticus]